MNNGLLLEFKKTIELYIEFKKRNNLYNFYPYYCEKFLNDSDYMSKKMSNGGYWGSMPFMVDLAVKIHDDIKLI